MMRVISRRRGRAGPGRAGSRGFTLVEVVAAFAVFVVIFAAVLQILSSAIGNTRRAAEFTQAALYAQSKLDTVGRDAYLEPGRWSGEFDEAYSWELFVEPYMVADDLGAFGDELPVALYYVVLVVHWGDALRDREAAFETLRAVDVHHEERRLTHMQ